MADFVDIKEVYEVEGYVRSVVSRSESLAGVVDEIEARQLKFAVDLSRLKKGTIQEIAGMKADVTFLKDSVKEVQMMITAMIAQMKNTLKSADFDSFEKRLDSWGPEVLVTRSEAKRIVQKLKN